MVLLLIGFIGGAVVGYMFGDKLNLKLHDTYDKLKGMF